MMLKYLLIFSISAIVISLELSHVAGTQVSKILGIPLSKNSLYNPEQDFECLDGSRRISFSKVNDDYCDCADGSDEPGTAACPNGFFYCENANHKAMYIPTSRVNDGICDCCDATDEYLSKAKCIPNCKELGREARAEAEKAAELAKEGNQIRVEMTAQGKRLQNDNTARLTKLKTDYEEAQMLQKEKEIIKTQVEERESIALEKYKPAEPEPQPEAEAEAEAPHELSAEEYFAMLDTDESHTITLKEIQDKEIFDRDGNGVVTDEEAMYFLGHQDEVKLEEFVDQAWANIKPFLMKEQGSFEAPSQTEEDEHHDEDHEEEHEEDHEADLPEEDEAQDSQDHADEKVEKEEKAEEVQYDEETQALIDEANDARTQYQQAEKAVLDLQSEMRTLEEKLSRDYGPEQVFAPLDGECFKYTDLEYVYSLCMYGKATQSAKSGGSEVNLGHWHEWTGPKGNEYSKMKFDRGLTCWNGPARSVDVELRCGKENQLISVSEPSRCEYAMVFTTPAVCNPNVDANDMHDEL